MGTNRPWSSNFDKSSGAMMVNPHYLKHKTLINYFANWPIREVQKLSFLFLQIWCRVENNPAEFNLINMSYFGKIKKAGVNLPLIMIIIKLPFKTEGTAATKLGGIIKSILNIVNTCGVTRVSNS